MHNRSNGVKLNRNESIDMSSVLGRLGRRGKDSELRNSSRRRSYLEKVSRVITPTRPSVQILESHPTACVNQEKDQPQIVVTGREFDQPATDLSQDVFDMTVQEALLVHEVGHILYTDQQAFTRTLSRVDMCWKAHYKRVWNTLEDGAIEEQLRNEFNVEDELYVLNANLFSTSDETDADADAKGSGFEDNAQLSLIEAVTLGLTDMAVFDSGKFSDLVDDSDNSITIRSPVEEQLLDELIEPMKSVVSDVLTESDPVRRTERIYDFCDNELFPRLENAEDQGEGQGGSKGTDDSQEQEQQGESGAGGLSDVFDGQQQQQQQQDGHNGSDATVDLDVMPVPKPDDSNNDQTGPASDADSLDEQDIDDVEESVENAADPSVESSDIDPDNSQSGVGGGSGSESDSDSDSDDDSDASGNSEDGSLSDDIEENRRGQLRQEAQEIEGAEEIVSEVEEYNQILSSVPTDFAGGAEYVNIIIPELQSEQPPQEREARVKQASRKIESDLMTSLRQERRSKRVRGKRQGRFDRGRMVNASRGSPRVFEQIDEGDEKEYDCIIVLDRSGSMGGERIEIAEESVAAFALALEECGVNVSVLGMLTNNNVVENAFDMPVQSDLGRILSDSARGGTPLTETLGIARERLENKAKTDHPFMIVVTDGNPNDTEAYFDELEKINFPVVGVYVQTGRVHDQYYHRAKGVDDADELRTTLSELAKDVMF